MLNKLRNKNVNNIVNKSFLNLVYLMINTYFHLSSQNKENLLLYDNGDSFFLEKELYNVIPVKENKFITMGNLEEKFQENFKQKLEKEYNLKGSSLLFNFKLTLDRKL